MLFGRKCVGTAVTLYDVNAAKANPSTSQLRMKQSDQNKDVCTSHNSLWKHILRIIVQSKSHLPLRFSQLFPLQDNGMQHWKTGSADPVRSCGPVDQQQRQPQNQRRAPREL